MFWAMNRREFITLSASGILSAITSGGERVEANVPETTKSKKSSISLVRTSERASGIKRAIDLLKINPVSDKDVLLKPNFNTADPFPGSTHNDTLTTLIIHLKDLGAKSVTIGERSGPPDTSDVLKDKGIYENQIKGSFLNQLYISKIPIIG